jgi:uncharacterized protein YukE
MATRVKYIEDQLRALHRQFVDKAALMHGAQNATTGDMDYLIGTCKADSVTTYVNSMQEWNAHYQRVVNAVENLTQNLQQAIDLNVQGEADALNLARS